MKNNKIKIGFVGAGFIGQLCHIINYIDNNKCEIIALADNKKKLGKLVASKYKIPKVYQNHKELLNNEKNIDAIIIVTKRSFTPDITLDCLNNNKSVFVEKPLALSYDKGIKLVTEAKKRKLIYKVGYNKIYDNGIQKAKKIFDNLILSKELGEIVFVRSHRFSGTGYCNQSGQVKTKEKEIKQKINSQFPKWLPKKFEKQYDSYLNLYCHNINLLRFFFNKNPKIDYVDFAKSNTQLVVFDFGNFKATLETKAYKDDVWDEEIEIFFEHGLLKIKTPPQQLVNVPAQITLFKRKSNTEIYKPNIKPSWSFKLQSDGFIKDLITKKISINSAEDSLNDLLLIENIWKKWI